MMGDTKQWNTPGGRFSSVKKTTMFCGLRLVASKPSAPASLVDVIPSNLLGKYN